MSRALGAVGAIGASPRDRHRRHTIRLPEGIEFSLPLAGPVSRCLAIAIDAGVALGVASLLGAFAAALQIVSPDIAGALVTVGYFAFTMLYGMACEWRWRGQTLGKRVLGIRVVDARGKRLGGSQVVIRNLLRAVDSFPGLYLVGGLTALVSPRFQRLGDMAAGTVVVRAQGEPLPDLEQWLGGRHNSLLAHPHLAARLRQAIEPDEARLLLSALLRRDHLEPAARLVVFAELATWLRERVALPDEIIAGVPDEQHVRNVVDVLFRSVR